MKAAVCYEYNKPLVVEEITMDTPDAGEVRVRYGATAICHSDLHFIEGAFPGILPAIAGHESAGYVEEVGEGVTSVAPGDSVVVTTLASCGKCRSCRSGLSHLCVLGDEQGSTRHLRTMDGQPIYTMSQIGGFAEQSIVRESQIVKIPGDFPIDRAALLACGVMTGFGAVVNRAKVRPMQSVVVIGTGGVGLNSVQGAAISGAYPIIAVDALDNKLEAAKIFGATHTVNPRETDVGEFVKQLTGGWGADYVFTTVSTGEVIQQSVRMLGRRGKLVIIGVPSAGATFTFSPFDFLDYERTLTACFMGSTDIQRDIPGLVSLYLAGTLKLDELITKRYPLDQINEAVKTMVEGKALRNVITY